MNRDDAVTIVGMISAHWPGSHWSVASMEAYANAIEPLDAELTTKAVVKCVNELEFYPKVSVLREFVRIEKRLSEPDGPIERMLNDTPSQIVPLWIKGWLIARIRYLDFRAWPEQGVHAVSDEMIPQDERERFIAEGSDLPISALFNTIGLEL